MTVALPHTGCTVHRHRVTRVREMTKLYEDVYISELRGALQRVTNEFTIDQAERAARRVRPGSGRQGLEVDLQNVEVHSPIDMPKPGLIKL